MTEINRHNYEAYLLDSLEGRLSAGQQLELDTFMALHPELAVDLEGMEEMTLDLQQSVFDQKALLKKTESDLVSEEQFISYIEQQLSLEESWRIEQSCAKNQALAKELRLYQSTIAVADTSMVYEGKETLKRRPKLIVFHFRPVSIAAAASVALLLMLYMLWPSSHAQLIRGSSYAYKETRKAGNTISSDKGHQPLPGINTSDSQKKNGPILHNHSIPGQQNLIARQQQKTPATDKKEADPGLRPDTATDGLTLKSKEPLKAQEPAWNKEPELVASAATRKTIVDVVIEHDEEEMESGVKKQGFWAMAGKTLKGLNKAGVKTVDGKEESSRDNSAYMLTLGGLNITHNKSH